MREKKHHSIEEVCRQCGFDREVLVRFVAAEWISPADWDNEILDEEDLARARLIRDLQEDFGVNDEAIPLILHLIDQLNSFQILFSRKNP